MTTTSLILETHNLEGGDGDVAGGLARVLGRLRDQTHPLTRLADFVITHRGVSPADRARCDALAGVPIRWIRLGDDAGYYDAKNAGFDASTGDLVVFADADCWPEPGWLEALLAPFATDPEVRAVAGRTTYRDGVFGTAASTIDFLYFATPLGARYTRNFYANNIAFRRDVFGARRYGDHALYRGHCTHLGLELHAAQVPIVYAARAHTVHRFPDDWRELVQLRLMRGRDTYELTPAIFASALGGKAMPRLGPVMPLVVLAARLGFSLRAINRQDLPPVRGVTKAAVAATVCAISALDAVGAVAGGLGLLEAKPHATLAYHGDDARIDTPRLPREPARATA